MPTNVVMEALSPTMEEGRLVEWKKQEGDAVAVGDVLAEVETDKAVMELVARAAGTLLKHIVEAGATVPVSEPVAVIGSPGDDTGEGGKRGGGEAGAGQRGSGASGEKASGAAGSGTVRNLRAPSRRRARAARCPCRQRHRPVPPLNTGRLQKARLAAKTMASNPTRRLLHETSKLNPGLKPRHWPAGLPLSAVSTWLESPDPGQRGGLSLAISKEWQRRLSLLLPHRPAAQLPSHTPTSPSARSGRRSRGGWPSRSDRFPRSTSRPRWTWSGYGRRARRSLP